MEQRLADSHADASLAAIRETIEAYRPALRADGGDCELLRVEGNLVKVRMSGACVLCRYASATLSGLQERLSERLGRPMRIEAVPVRM
jgi:NifU-like protein